MSSISKVLDKVMTSYGLEKKLRQQVFMTCWTQAVGEPFASLTRPLFLDYQGNLVVSVKDAS
ncbi:MAG: DUF721 domain-containing protein, partial [Cyanobacteria bacterium]|nr:DUF721 domain-containing protein [Cyanobacteriota bacterium]